MARKRSRSSGPEVELNMSSMIDVVFLLLIYFVVTQKPVIEDVHLPADLPSPNPSDPPNPPPPPPFRIDVKRTADEQEYRLDGRRYKLDELREYLKSVKKDTTVIINCDPNALHRKLITLLDLVHDEGFTNINVIPDVGEKFEP